MKKVLAVLVVLAVGCVGSMVFAAESETPVVKGNVEVYGQAKVSVDLISTGSSSTGIVDKNLSRVSSNSSRLGVKGKEDLGNGLSLVMQAEMAVGYDVGTTTFKWRETYAGFSHEQVGTLLFGIHYTPYYLATGPLNPFGDTMGDYRAIMGTVNGKLSFGNRTDNTIMYITPKWGGFQMMASTSESGQENKVSTASAAGQYSVSATYSGGPLYVALAHEQQNNGFGKFDAAGAKESGSKVGAGFTFGGTKVGLVYEALKNDQSDSVYTRNAYYASVSQKLGAETIKIAYGKAEDGKSSANTGATLMSIGIDHTFSKRTKVYALYAKTKNEDGATYGLGTDAEGGAYAPTIAGDSPSVISFGVNHSF
jgi:predicted porin